jgi:hypothetical protein
MSWPRGATEAWGEGVALTAQCVVVVQGGFLAPAMARRRGRDLSLPFSRRIRMINPFIAYEF